MNGTLDIMTADYDELTSAIKFGAILECVCIRFHGWCTAADRQVHLPDTVFADAGIDVSKVLRRSKVSTFRFWADVDGTETLCHWDGVRGYFHVTAG